MMSVSTTSDCDHDSKSDSNRPGGDDQRRVDSDFCETGAEMEDRDSVASVDARVSGNERSEEARVRVCAESEGEIGVVGEFMDSRAGFEIDVNNGLCGVHEDRSIAQNAQFGSVEEHGASSGGRVEVEKKRGDFKYTSLLSEFDDYVASEKNVTRFGFEVGDMVWGKVKSHPWWPGHIFNEAFATGSVRRVRREGLVLVAFFGDNSYGWFDPSQLVPFDANFAEKSRQTNSRTFVKAVEEAMDELSRRRGLGLACKCRNLVNFRHTTVEDHYAVDVPNYAPGGVYSEIQIRKARDGFRPGETLSFIKQLALAPLASDLKSIEFVKKKATVFAYRKAVFEEYDETYEQAFGVQGARSSRDLKSSELHVEMPRPAPFSGPLVIAETLGSEKDSVKSPKVKDHSKKDKYLFKRREESNNSKLLPGTSPSPALAYMEGSPALAANDFVLQKRTPDISVKPEVPPIHNSGSISTDSPCSIQDVPKVETMDQHASLDRTPFINKEEAPSKADSDLIMTVPDVKDGGSQPSEQEGNETVDLKHEVNVSVPHEGFRQPEPILSTKVEGTHGVDQVANRVVGVKKAKTVKKSLVGQSRSDISPSGEKKKKKRALGSQSTSGPPQKRLATGKVRPSVGKSPGKSTSVIGLERKEDPQVNHQTKEEGTNNFAPTSVWTKLTIGELNVPQLLTDLQSLALIPFHGAERNSPANIREYFGKFRSVAFQKSLVPSQTAGSGGSEVRPSQAGEDVSDVAGEEGTEPKPSILPSKPVKLPARPNNPMKAGRKRAPSDRQEENATKKVKRMSDLKSMAAEKKTNSKTQEPPQPDGRNVASPAKKTAARPDPRRPQPPPAKVPPEPTMLVMKFPPQTSLPSVAELKARFARFGPLDHMAIRVFWKTSMCRVVFRHKRHAQNALNHASTNASLFGNANVRYYLREIGVEEQPPAPEVPESKDPEIKRPRLNNPAHQPKSILKKPTTGGEESSARNNNGRGTARVKFMLSGEETAGGSSNKNNKSISINNNASFADDDDGVATTMNFNSNNKFQKVNPSPISPDFPLPSQYHHHQQQHNPNTPHHHDPEEAVDISEQMMNLLTRCKDVVSNLTGFLGYVPYHPL